MLLRKGEGFVLAAGEKYFGKNCLKPRRLIQQGDLPAKPVGASLLIPYRSLLVFVGVARWRFQEIVE